MHEQSENDGRLKETDESQTNLANSSSTYNENANENMETTGASALAVLSKTENTATPSIHTEEVILVNEISNQVEGNGPEMSSNERIESSLQETDIGGSSALREIVGDDFSKKSEVNILCECEPNVAGAAVPTVKSFIPTEVEKSVIKCNTSNCKSSDSDLKRSNACVKQGTTLQKHMDMIKHVSRIRQKYKEEIKDKSNSESTNKKSKCSPQSGRCLKPGIGKLNPEMKNNCKKPSLIPKLARPGSSNNNNKCLDYTNDDLEKRETVKSNTQKVFSKPSNICAKSNEKRTRQSSENESKNVKTTLESNSAITSPNASNISTRMFGLQERLKATTSMLRQKIEKDKSIEKIPPEENIADSSVEEHINKDVVPNKKTVEDLYNSIFCLKNIAATLSENNTLKSQTKYIEKLFSNISEIKLIADKLCMNDHSKSKDILHNSNSKVIREKEKSPKTSATNGKDNKIYIKVLHAKDRKGDTKKKSKELYPEQSEEVKTDLSLGSKLTSASLHSDACVTDKSQEENKIKEADSMDGVFIPSFEPPVNLEEDEETNGLDITITFPEFSQLYSNCTESHLSVCLSDISAEALRKLKRCPKDFTLKMDFVEGKVLFQSGRGPPNNFQIGPDLKFSENFVDTKKSDVISIKPSTECSFGSQLIPVCDNPKEIKSFKSLKSTDSELFNVVSLPFMYKNPYLATSHKSCMAFRNDQIMSMAIMAKHLFKSMPQIPSLTNIFEEKVIDSSSRTDSRKETKESPESKKVD